jgi:DNA-binding phage protein
MRYNWGMDPLIANLEARRVKQNLSISKLARMSGVARPSIHRVISGETSPTLSWCHRVATALGLELTTRKSKKPSC